MIEKTAQPDIPHPLMPGARGPTPTLSIIRNVVEVGRA